MPKPPSQTAARQATSAEADKLAKQLADKPYGGMKDVEPKAISLGISLPEPLVELLQDTARANKRGGSSDLRTVSAIIRDALERAGYIV